jgi:hypothetical protein
LCPHHGAEYYSSQPDPLADSAIGIVQHMNTDHGDALVLLAKAFAGIEAQEATMTCVDRLGFHVRLKTKDGTRGARIAFLREVSRLRCHTMVQIRRARSPSPPEPQSLLWLAIFCAIAKRSF